MSINPVEPAPSVAEGDDMSVEDDMLVNVDKSRGILLGDELIPTDMSSLRNFSEQRIDFYQHLMPNGTKIERKYFYANITFLTPHPHRLVARNGSAKKNVRRSSYALHIRNY
jgi:hypothetical protein